MWLMYCNSCDSLVYLVICGIYLECIHIGNSPYFFEGFIVDAGKFVWFYKIFHAIMQGNKHAEGNQYECCSL